jgi:hypothetical protein
MRWGYDGYDFTYNQNGSLINCQTSSIGQNYYAIMTDQNRVLIAENKQSLLSYILDAILNFDPAVIPIFVYLILIILIFPVIALCLDRRDYNIISEDDTEEEQEFFARIADSKDEPYSKVLYNKKLINQYRVLEMT